MASAVMEIASDAIILFKTILSRLKRHTRRAVIYVRADVVNAFLENPFDV